MSRNVAEAPVPDDLYADPVECTHGSIPPPPPSAEGLSPRERDFYQHLRRSIRAYLAERGPFKYAEVLLVGPDLFHVLCRLVGDPRIPAIHKAKLAATLAYFISPVGLVPELFTGPIGYVDDIALTAYVLSGLLATEHAHIVREHWAGDEDVLQVVHGVLDVAASANFGALWQRVKAVRIPSPLAAFRR